MERPKTRTVYRRNASKPNTLELLSEPLKPLKATEILIRVHTVSLNYRDINILRGTNPWPTSDNGVPCSDAAGEVTAIGAEVTRFKVGDRVSPILDQKSITGQEQSREWLGGEVDGILADHVIFPEEKVVLIPGHLSWAEAACLPCAGLTAWSALAVGGELVAGKTVLIQGTGGVSLMGLKLAIAVGCKVIITSSSDAKLDKVREMAGGKKISTVNYSKTLDWEREVLRLNGGRGVDIVFENGGSSSLMKSIAATTKRGIISQIGYLGQQDPKDLNGLISLLIDRTVTLRGINVGSRLEFEAMNRVIDANEMNFEDIIDKTFSFDQAEEAFKYLKSQQHVGKVVIVIQ
ncbi:zinc-binding oxidoreductase [Mollisia scopiformis]|uniref:Zinc-binding oxidoreductase n=1 Tax=Mollisia scopiformis TaxID=149040 RepID=A0A132B736_MOLSC|nr:zinc-binding oxidoreductase [Mollisia scopiformis]KUJ08220.1 zinc-binding oxidoreductase [Mollisia scopiformis]